MKNCLTTLLLLAAFIHPVVSQWKKNNNYQYTLHLTRAVDDKVAVELLAPRISSSEINFYLPKIVPGTYAIADYGRYVADFNVFDKKRQRARCRAAERQHLENQERNTPS